mgnify:CR=1 FL=1
MPVRPLVLGKKAAAFRLECVDCAENRKGNASGRICLLVGKQIKSPQSYRKAIGFAAAGRDSFLDAKWGRKNVVTVSQNSGGKTFDKSGSL